MNTQTEDKAGVIEHVALGRTQSGEYPALIFHYASGSMATFTMPDGVTADLLAEPSRLPLRMDLLKTALRAMNPNDWRWYPAKPGQLDTTFAGEFVRLADRQCVKLHTNDDADCPVRVEWWSPKLDDRYAVYAATLFVEGLHRTVYEYGPASGVQVRGLADVATEGGAS